jgi:hypothetical protein
MGLQPFLELNDWPNQIIATVLETYYGGRAECHVRRTPVPGVMVDFTSEYPTVFVLQRLHWFLVAESISYEDEPPERVQDLLDRMTADMVLEKRFWADELHALVLVAPNGDRLPTRAKYNASSNHPGGSYNVGVPVRTGGKPQWYTLADACASALQNGKAPTILKVLRFRADGVQGLEPISIAGKPAYQVDPTSEDFIQRLVELRADVKTDLKEAQRIGHESLEAELSAIQQAMKVIANATSYGSAIELNPVEHRKGAWINVHTSSGETYRVHRDRTEEPGRWFNPLIATLVAAGGRLLLATAMRLLATQGGTYVFCDTDSLFIAATEHGQLLATPGGTHHTPTAQPAIKCLSWRQVNEIVDRFKALDPYRGPDHPKSILKIEDENYNEHGEQREIECLAIAAKRYGLFIRRFDGTPQIVSSGSRKKRSEHGLGHLLPPTTTGNQNWLDEWWEHLLHLELGFEDHAEPEWFDQPAAGQLTITSQRDLEPFHDYNKALPYGEQIKPWNFINIAHPADTERGREGGPRTLIAPFETDPIKRIRAQWIDRDRPNKLPRQIHTSESVDYREGSIKVLSYRDYFARYRQHPEAKALDPTDGKRCHPWTRGELAPWDVRAAGLLRVGKESNRLTGTARPTFLEAERLIDYSPQERKCRACEAIVTGRREWCSEACRKRAARASRSHTDVVQPSGLRKGSKSSSSD